MVSRYKQRTCMSKTCVRGFALSLAVLFLASVVLAQELEKKTPVPTTPRADCESNTCISKVLYFPDSTAYELQDVVNTFRTIASFTNIEPKLSDHAIALTGTPEQLAAAEKILSALESLRLSGGHDRSSVLVYQLKGLMSGAARERMLAQYPQAASTICDLSTCYIKAMYLPDLSLPQLQDFANELRTTADFTRVQIIRSRHVLVIAGTSEQVALADEMLPTNTSALQ
jgi:hypothetical protein